MGSLAIPSILKWREETAKLSPLTRRIFWTYAGYIFTTNVCFGLLSTFAPNWLLDGSYLSRAVDGFISLYWGARLVIQILFFRGYKPPGNIYKIADIGFTLLFIFLTAIYGAAALDKAII